MIIGGGMIGLIMLQLAKLSGAAKIILLEPVASKRELAYKLGASLCIDPVQQDVKNFLKENGIEHISTVIECVGNVKTMEQAIDFADKKSTVMLYGLSKPNDTISVKPFELFKKEIVLKASYINPYTQQRALDLINTNKIDVSSMIYLKTGLDNLSEVLSNSKLRANGKIIICPEL
jgi:threonine dehydrogenase-like Zn-dependent dehydrogenase